MTTGESDGYIGTWKHADVIGIILHGMAWTHPTVFRETYREMLHTNGDIIW